MAHALKGDEAQSRAAADQVRRVDPSAGYATRRKPQETSAAAFKEYHRNVYLPAGRKAGLFT